MTTVFGPAANRFLTSYTRRNEEWFNSEQMENEVIKGIMEENEMHKVEIEML